eukprot:COSAG01_NODE_8438_length_2784_cov_35.279330_5_plen_87_part_00
MRTGQPWVFSIPFMMHSCRASGNRTTAGRPIAVLVQACPRVDVLRSLASVAALRPAQPAGLSPCLGGCWASAAAAGANNLLSLQII